MWRIRAERCGQPRAAKPLMAAEKPPTASEADRELIADRRGSESVVRDLQSLLVFRFRSSLYPAAPSGANFEIKGTLANI